MNGYETDRETTVREAYQAMSRGDFQTADELSDRLLQVDPQGTDTCLINLMLQYQISEKKDIDLLTAEYQSSPFYQNLLRWGDKAVLSELWAISEKNHRKAAEQAMRDGTEESLGYAIDCLYQLQKLHEKDTDRAVMFELGDKIDQCRERLKAYKERQRQEKVYQEAKEMREMGKPEEAKKALSKLTIAPAAAEREACDREIARQSEARAKAAHREYNEDMITIMIVAAVLLVGCVIMVLMTFLELPLPKAAIIIGTMLAVPTIDTIVRYIRGFDEGFVLKWIILFALMLFVLLVMGGIKNG